MACDPTTPHHQDSSLPYSQAPAVSVRLLSTGTMKPLRLPTFSPGPSFIGLDRDTLGAPKDGFGSPKFPANPSDLCRALGPRPAPVALVITALGAWPLQLLPQRHQPDMTFEALSHGFSHGCLRFVPSSRATTQNSLPVADQPFRVGFSMPTEFVWRVSHLHALPSPRAFLGAKQFSLWRSAAGPAARVGLRRHSSPMRHSGLLRLGQPRSAVMRIAGRIPSPFARGHARLSFVGSICFHDD